MTAHLLRLDHLVISARTLDEGTQYVADTLGVAPAGGGAHPTMRTHNRLLNLWNGVYLEVIAIDPDAAGPADGAAPRARLFALDDPATHTRLESGPYLSHWVARVERPKHLTTWQRQYPERIAPIVPMTRGDLTWGLSVREDGALPGFVAARAADETADEAADETGDAAGNATEAGRQVEGQGVVPSLIQWDTPRHPSAALPETGLALRSLKAVHPRADAVTAHLRWLGAAHLIEVAATGGHAALVAEIDTPDGLRTLE